jgi:hypothetical protein
MSVDPRLLLGVFFFLLIGLLKAAYWQWLRGARKREYCKLLRDPLWEDRKDQYYSRHEKRCAVCGTTRRVQLAHLYYTYGKLPWSYPDSAYRPLCDFHHRKFDGR